MFLKECKLCPENLIPLHEVWDQEHAAALTIAMREHGWQGRPLLAYGYEAEEIRLLTGTHRRQAAIDAGLGLVPIVLMVLGDNDDNVEADVQDWTFWKELSSAYDDDLRLLLVSEIPAAVTLMDAELESNFQQLDDTR